MRLLSRKNVEYLGARRNLISLPGLLFVLAVHGLLFYILWNQRPTPPSPPTVTLFAEMIAAPVPKVIPKAETVLPKPTIPQPINKPKSKPSQHRLVAEAPLLPKKEPVVAPLEPELKPELESEPELEPAAPVESAAVTSPPVQMDTGPVKLSSELSVSCPKLAAPAYPPISRRMGEEGKLVLRVELDENGRIYDAQVAESSGHTRLDNAALDAVKSWQCRPSLRNGQPVRAVALQPFNFVLQGN
ncbi:outer membrane transport energization protein TonB [Nitrosomonas cryotolerans]|uniref:Outer membrane transport energization protein TonB n=1 Tax=Nitrosomonas cryotolerans ATCC 49181 TaxID=1131553 RepID=A0A1N6FQW6_9PROT|nr:energy transducer TonB [Nitrosomonas cryotolerans]SFP94340.1 outer membrane transport energization protein TonB [Nitrosomonas cryotolerans]SIN97634.1 outer membrane transport energization protein TonB [Nitrosomonas cryotolerans ATCC 49181]